MKDLLWCLFLQYIIALLGECFNKWRMVVRASSGFSLSAMRRWKKGRRGEGVARGNGHARQLCLFRPAAAQADAQAHAKVKSCRREAPNPDANTPVKLHVSREKTITAHTRTHPRHKAKKRPRKLGLKSGPEEPAQKSGSYAALGRL